MSEHGPVEGWAPPLPVRPTTAAMLMLLPVRIFLAAGWLRAGAEKVLDAEWWNGAQLKTFVNEHHDLAIPFFRPVMTGLVLPAADLVAVVVAVTEILCGVAIAVGRPLRLALRWGVVLNVAFILSGEVSPSAFYIVMEIVMLFAIADGQIGVRPSEPTRLTWIYAGLALFGGAAVAPFVRTMQPRDVIHDPAIMLVFMAVLVGATLILRWTSVHAHLARSRVSKVFIHRVTVWAHAKPVEDPHGEYRLRPRQPPKGAAALAEPSPASPVHAGRAVPSPHGVRAHDGPDWPRADRHYAVAPMPQRSD